MSAHNLLVIFDFYFACVDLELTRISSVFGDKLWRC